jgi:hypothetical protein
MNYPGAIVVAAGLISGALLLSSQGSSQNAAGRFQIGGVAQSGLASWRVDTGTGEMAYCSASPPTSVTCVKGGKP